MDRVLLDQNGLKISKPGFDVKTAGDFDLLFSPNFRPPQLIKKGMFSIATSYTEEVIHTVSYGTTYTVPPYVAAIAKAPSWTLKIGTYSGSEFTYLNNVWHTFLIEWPNFLSTNIYNPPGTQITRNNSDPTPGLTYMPFYWASAKFIARIYNNQVNFCFNNVPNGITCKYAILDIS